MEKRLRGAMEVVETNNLMENELHKVLHMNGGDGCNSYSNNSSLQNKVILRTKPILQESIKELCIKEFPECIRIVDMGCSSGPNTFLPILEIIEAVDEICCRLNRVKPMLQVFLNDLPENDFNSIFISLPSFYKKLEEEKAREFGSCFIAAMPGNFYGRLFPSHSLDFVHSSFSLHWCSQVPEIPLNKENIYLAKTSPPNVHRAYLKQFEKDFKKFLSCRSQEMKPGGRVVITIYGRDEDHCFSKEHKPTVWELFGMTLNDMVLEGLIEEQKLDSFNIPLYGPSAGELKHVIEVEGSFFINRLEIFHMSWDAGMDDGWKNSAGEYARGKYVANRTRSISESILATHFGSEHIDLMFQRFTIRIEEHMAKMSSDVTDHIISMTKK